MATTKHKLEFAVSYIALDTTPRKYGRKSFHVWETGADQSFSPLEAVIGYLRNEHRKTISDLTHDRCFSVLDAIGIMCDLENNREVEFMGVNYASNNKA